MIKNSFTLVELDQMSKVFYKEIETLFDISNKITLRPVDEATPAFDYIANNIESIISDRPGVLDNHVSQLNPLIGISKGNFLANHPGFSTKQVNQWIKNIFCSIFNYDFDHLSFTKRDNGKIAYDHAITLNMNTCPYCNSQFTFTIKNNRIKSRPHFDHFVSKSKHPYLSLSFYNLVPSCYTCNSNLKGSKPFSFSTHLHPFVDSIEGLYRFRTNIDSIDFLTNKKNFSISLEPCPNAHLDDRIRAERSLRDFGIQDRYNFHKDYASEIIKKSYFYNNTAIKELLEDFTVNGNKLFSSEAEIIELLLGNFIHEDKLHKRILSKLTKDIAEEFEINA